MDILPEIQLAIEREVTKAKDEARSEAEKARNQSIGVLAFVALVLSLAGALGISQMIKSQAKTAAAEAVRSSIGQGYVEEANRALTRVKEDSDAVSTYRDQAAKRLKDLKLDDDWIAPQLAQGWKPYEKNSETPYNPPSFFKDSFGLVHLRGLVEGRGGAIFTLPIDYRPNFRQLFVVSTYPNAYGRVDILSSGEVILEQGNPSWVSLDSITFRVVRQNTSKATTVLPSKAPH